MLKAGWQALVVRLRRVVRVERVTRETQTIVPEPTVTDAEYEWLRAAEPEVVHRLWEAETPGSHVQCKKDIATMERLLRKHRAGVA